MTSRGTIICTNTGNKVMQSSKHKFSNSGLPLTLDSPYQQKNKRINNVNSEISDNLRRTAQGFHGFIFLAKLRTTCHATMTELDLLNAYFDNFMQCV